MLRSEKRLNPNLVKEVSLCIKSKYREKYLYERDTGKWWQYSLHRWYPMTNSPLQVMYNEVKDYYTCNAPRTGEWKKVLDALPSLLFRDRVLKDAECIMQTQSPSPSPSLYVVSQSPRVCCANGILDMTTMRLQDGRAEDGMFQGSEVEYVEGVEGRSAPPPLPSIFSSATGRAFLSFCRNAFLGVASNAFFVVQSPTSSSSQSSSSSSNYTSILQTLRNVMGDYAEFYNPSKAPYMLKHAKPKMTVIECECHITVNTLNSILSCGVLNVVLVCKKMTILDPQIFTSCTISLVLGETGETCDISDQSLLLHILRAPPFVFDGEVAEECKRNAASMDMYTRFINARLITSESSTLNSTDVCTECKAWIMRTYPNIRVPYPTTVRRKLEERLGGWQGYVLK